MERKNKIPNTRLNRFYDEIDFELELDMARELIDGDMNFIAVLYRVDHTNTNVDIYGETDQNDVIYKEPVELNIIPDLIPSQQQNYAPGGRLQYEEHGNFNFYVLDKELDEKDVKITKGDIIGYLGSNNTLKYFKVVFNNNVNIDNVRSHYGYSGYYREIICVTIDVNEFNG